MIIVGPSFSKRSLFSVYTKTQSQRFKSLPFEEHFRDRLVLTVFLINCGRKAAFSNSSGEA